MKDLANHRADGVSGVREMKDLGGGVLPDAWSQGDFQATSAKRPLRSITAMALNPGEGVGTRGWAFGNRVSI